MTRVSVFDVSRGVTHSLTKSACMGCVYPCIRLESVPPKSTMTSGRVGLFISERSSVDSLFRRNAVPAVPRINTASSTANLLRNFFIVSYTPRSEEHTSELQSRFDL